MNITSLILIPLIGCLLFMIYKVITNTDIPNISIKFDISRKNSPSQKFKDDHTINIKDDHRTNINVDRSIHYHDESNHYYDTAKTNNSSTSDPITAIILLFFCSVFIFTLYQRYIKYINRCIILTPVIVATIYIGLAIFYKTKNKLSVELIKYLFISFFSILMIVISSLSPLFEPDNLNTLLISGTTPSITKDFQSISFVIFKLLGYGLNIFINFCFLISILKNHSLPKAKSTYFSLVIISIICFLLSSGIFSILIETYKNSVI